MKNPVVIVHYHLDTGGVTQVIETQVRALQEANTPYLILTGKAYDGPLGFNQHVIPGLNYKTHSDDPQKEAEDLFSQCFEAISTRFDSQEVVWHIHNPTLGKNILWPYFIEFLTISQEKILLQCHDFAEDGRPNNYKLTAYRDNIFPIAPNVHYAFVNSQDLSKVQQAGIPVEQLHLLPNAVSEHTDQLNNTDYNKKPLVLYPVRGIRRKNIGEFLLWSALAPEGSQFALTLEPDNPEWRSIFSIWKKLADDLKLPAMLGCINNENAPGSNGTSYQDWLESATHCITTSVAEGFGLTFLDPLARNLPLIGRNLPKITEDFKLPSSTTDHLYQKILVSLEDIDSAQLKNDLEETLTNTYKAYGLSLSEVKEELDIAWNHITQHDYVDFGNLPERLQISLLIRLKTDGFKKFRVLKSDGYIEDASKWIAKALSPKFSSHSENKATVKPYQSARYQEKLIKTLSETHKSKTSAPKWLDKREVLSKYLSPSTFHFLRS